MLGVRAREGWCNDGTETRKGRGEKINIKRLTFPRKRGNDFVQSDLKNKGQNCPLQQWEKTTHMKDTFSVAERAKRGWKGGGREHGNEEACEREDTNFKLTGKKKGYR